MSAPSDPASWDIRDVVGMRSRLGTAIACTFCLANLPQVLGNMGELDHPVVVVVAWVVLSAAVIGVVLLPGDPLRPRFAVPLALSAPIGSALVLSQLRELPVTFSQLWFNVLMLAPLVFMCVRGAVLFAWIGMFTQIVVVVYWATVTGQGIGVGLMWTPVNVPPLLMATFFAYKVRPVARNIFALRDEVDRRARQQAATLATSDERDRALGEVDRLVRPIIEKIASGAELTVEDQTECSLLDAQLRDRMRGGMLVDEHVASLARTVRKGGVAVTLLDDGGLAAQPESFVTIVRSELCSALERAGTCDAVIARIHPPGRMVLATVLVEDQRGALRTEVDTSGRVVTTQEVFAG